MQALYQAIFPDLHIHHAIDLHPDSSDFRMHLHDDYEIFLFLSGEARFLVEGTEYPLTEGALLLMRPSESHAVRIVSDHPYERIALNFSPTLTDAADPQRTLLRAFHDRPLGERNLYTPAMLGDTDAAALMRAMCVPKESGYRRHLAVLSHLFPLLEGVDASFSAAVCESSGIARDPGTASQIIAYLNEMLFSPLSVSDIAQHFYLSVSQLERVFREATHSPVGQYIRTKRVIAARAMIEQGASAHRAAQECCFEDYSSFYRAYRRHYGHAPSLDGK